eukprot:CAMPEP_0175349804 /NCGR_PEP_ID=MMETSP0095-20121207/10590_1 /TAXON_ID=311494 /ORGANISM="Alexandrium monilatum, Strain CCMP3105" /LENGTH=217 /DNA_ID=CAMNT_0016647351 /DNA_START=148 /DNA_END=797 /DNA_ORIENTATION=+
MIRRERWPCDSGWTSACKLLRSQVASRPVRQHVKVPLLRAIAFRAQHRGEAFHVGAHAAILGLGLTPVCILRCADVGDVGVFAPQQHVRQAEVLVPPLVVARRRRGHEPHAELLPTCPVSGLAQLPVRDPEVSVVAVALHPQGGADGGHQLHGLAVLLRGTVAQGQRGEPPPREERARSAQGGRPEVRALHLGVRALRHGPRGAGGPGGRGPVVALR